MGEGGREGGKEERRERRREGEKVGVNNIMGKDVEGKGGKERENSR